MAPVMINANVIDLFPPTSSPGYFADDVAQSNYILVQCKYPLTTAYRETIQACGAECLRVEDDKTLLCRFNPTDLTELRRLDFVDQAVVYHTDFVVHPRVWDYMRRRGGNDFVPVSVLLHDDCSQQEGEVLGAIRYHIDPRAQILNLEPRRVCVRVHGRQSLSKIAALDIVRSVDLIGYDSDI